MEQKLDLRIKKTYLALTSTLLQMMKEMRFEDIRVSELCTRAMIRKSTFYKHFGDKYELLAFVVRQMQEQLNRQLEQECAGKSAVERYTRLIAIVFDFLSKNQALVQSALESPSFSLILSTLSEQFVSDAQQKLEDNVRQGEKLPVEPEVMAAFFVGGLMETANHWLKKGKPLDEQHLREQLGALLSLCYPASCPGAAQAAAGGKEPQP